MFTLDTTLTHESTNGSLLRIMFFNCNLLEILMFTRLVYCRENHLHNGKISFHVDVKIKQTPVQWDSLHMTTKLLKQSFVSYRLIDILQIRLYLVFRQLKCTCSVLSEANTLLHFLFKSHCPSKSPPDFRIKKNSFNICFLRTNFDTWCCLKKKKNFL